MERVINWLFRRLGAGKSIYARLRVSFTIIVCLLIIPSGVSIGLTLHYSQTYHETIRRVEQVSSLKPIMQTQIRDEMYYVVAGHKTFSQARQYELLDLVEAEIDDLALYADPDSTIRLNVAKRTLSTLRGYIDRMGTLMTTDQPIAESEALLDEVGNISELVADMLADYADGEISTAAALSNRLHSTLYLVVGLLIALLLFTILFALLAQGGVQAAIRTPIEQLEEFAGALASGNLLARAPQTSVVELTELTSSLNAMAERLQSLIDENRLEQENLKKSELRALQAQINPHFLYNTLDAIVWLAESDDNDEVIHITRALSDFFRISLSQGRDWIPLSDEIRHLAGYLTIQKIRYRDILDYSIEIPDELGNYRVLKLLLQPLVENAIYHGIKHRRGRGMIRVIGAKENNFLILKVEDNGAGMSEERLSQVRSTLAGDGTMNAGYGLFNVNKRIQLYYNQPQGIWIESTESEGTCVTVRIPVHDTVQGGEENVQGISGGR